MATPAADWHAHWNIDNLPPPEALPLVRAFNDDTCRAVADAPLAFAGLASLPLHDMQASCEELRRARSGGLRGFVLPADAFGSLRQATRLAPLLGEADDLGAHLFVHPGYLHAPPEPALKPDNWWARAIVLEAQHQLGTAMLTLCSTPLLDSFPHVTVQVANLGGGVPFHLERLRAVAADDPGETPDRFRFDMRRIVVDSASFGRLGIGVARKALGADKVVLGTDMPVFDALQAVEGFRLPCQNGDEWAPQGDHSRRGESGFTKEAARVQKLLRPCSRSGSAGNA